MTDSAPERRVCLPSPTSSSELVFFLLISPIRRSSLDSFLLRRPRTARAARTARADGSAGARHVWALAIPADGWSATLSVESTRRARAGRGQQLSVLAWRAPAHLLPPILLLSPTSPPPPAGSPTPRSLFLNDAPACTRQSDAPTKVRNKCNSQRPPGIRGAGSSRIVVWASGAGGGGRRLTQLRRRGSGAGRRRRAAWYSRMEREREERCGRSIPSDEERGW